MTGSVVANGFTFDLLRCGPSDGETVLFLHGFPQKAATWTPLLASFGDRNYEAVAFSQRGYSRGARPARRGAYKIGRLVSDVMGVADAIGAERFHLVGHDWGGVVGWHVAARHPDRVSTFTSLSTPHPSAFLRSLVGRQAIRSLYAAWFQVPFVSETMLSAFHGAPLRFALQQSGLSERWIRTYVDGRDWSEVHAALQWYRASTALRLISLPPVTVPTMLIWGNQDPAIGRTAAETTGREVHGPFRFVELDASHWLPEDHSDEVAALVLNHLDTTGEIGHLGHVGHVGRTGRRGRR